MANPVTTTNQGGNFQTIGNGGVTGSIDYQGLTPPAHITTQAATVTTGSGTVTPAGGFLGVLAY